MGDQSESQAPESGQALVNVQERSGDYDGTCLRPLGLCELGGACDVCWYRPDHPRFEKQKDE